MKNRILKPLIFSLFSLSATLPVSAQFWDLLLQPVFMDGLYYAVVAGPNEPHWKETTFAAYPYDADNAGLFLPTNLVGDKSRFNAVAHFQNNERHTFGGYTQLKYAPISLLTLEASYVQLFDKTNDTTNKLGFTSFNLSYNRLRHHRIHCWWGIGGIFLNESDDTIEDNKAFALNLGFNYYFKKPLSLYVETQMGEVNDSFGALSQARIQVHLERYLLYAGYQDVNFGELEYGSLAIGGGVYF